jgi:hypothetical protein
MVTAKHGSGHHWHEKLRGQWKGATIGEEDRRMVRRHNRAAYIDAEWWVWQFMIMRRRMAAAKHCRKEP